MSYRYQDLKPGDAYYEVWQQFRVHWKCARLSAWRESRFSRQFGVVVAVVSILLGWLLGVKYFVIAVFFSFVVKEIADELIEKAIYKYPRLVPRNFLGIPVALHCPKCKKMFFRSSPGVVKLSGPLFDSASMEIVDEDHAEEVIGEYLLDLNKYELEEEGKNLPVLGLPVQWELPPRFTWAALKDTSCKTCGLPLWAPDDPDKETNHESQNPTL